jgi:plasmid replication initiation protein
MLLKTGVIVAFKKQELIVKSNRLIEASYRLSLNEQRIILYAISQCREDQKGLFPDLPVLITADSFAKRFPSIDKKHVYRQLKDAMDALYDRSVTIYEEDETTGYEQVSKTRWISKASYIDGAGQVKIVFTPDIIKYITRLETEFTSYQLEKVGNMTSAHAIRIYELLTQYRDIGHRSLSLVWLREALQLAPDEYKLTADFIKRIIEPSIQQISSHSDLTISYKPVKTSRAITDFIFKIKIKENRKSVKITDQDYRDRLEKSGQQRIIDDETF